MSVKGVPTVGKSAAGGKSTATTTIKVSTATRDALRSLATLDGLTLDEQIMVMVRRDRRRRMGEQLASQPLDTTDRFILEASVADVHKAVRHDTRHHTPHDTR